MLSPCRRATRVMRGPYGSTVPRPSVPQDPLPDFGRGWPHVDLLQGQLPQQLAESFQRGLAYSAESLNYGHKLGHPKFLEGLASFLSHEYGAPVDPETLMTTGGASMGVDLALRMASNAPGVCVFEEPTYYLSFTMARDHGLECRSVPMYEDGMDLDRLEELCVTGNVRMVYTIPVHHNPTGYTMGNAKRQRLLELARKYDFMVVADEAYQLLNFGQAEVKPLYYHDCPDDPRVVSVGTFSKLIGPGVKVGWLQAHKALLKRMASAGYITSGGNPVMFSSMGLLHFMVSGQLAEHIAQVSRELRERCQLLCQSLGDLGLEVYEPRGGYFIWVKGDLVKGLGKDGKDFTITQDQCRDRTRLCFSYLSREEMARGIRILQERKAQNLRDCPE